jgi:hypothetical protein
MVNYAPHPVVEDVLLLPGGAPLPMLADTLEYDASLPHAVEGAFMACLRLLPHYPELGRGPVEGLPQLIKALVEFLCADPHLSDIYAGHQAIDIAYMKRVLAVTPTGPGTRGDEPYREAPSAATNRT